jgi:ketosteroid isomerase-like protein
MRVTIRASVFLMLIGIAGACAPAPPAGPTPAELVAAANASDRQFIDAFNRADVDGVMATYWNSPELVSIGLDGMGAQGWDATKAATADMFKGMSGATLEFTESHNTAYGDVVLGWGRWKVTIPAAEGPGQVMEGRYSDAKAMRDGRMVVIMDQASVPMAPPPPSAPPAAVKK